MVGESVIVGVEVSVGVCVTVGEGVNVFVVVGVDVGVLVCVLDGVAEKCKAVSVITTLVFVSAAFSNAVQEERKIDINANKRNFFIVGF
jgi:hypothetical protein